MKSILLTIFISLSIFCNGQETAIRRLSVGVDSFSVEYKYNPNTYMEPSVGRMICDSNMQNCREDTAAYRLSRHYFATISVYKIVGKNNKLIGEPFGGYYVLNGCFEDVPEGFVQKAKYLQGIIDSNAALKKKNGANAIYQYVVTWTEYKTKYVSKEYGIDIKEIHKRKTFKTNPEAHKFIDKELLAPIIGGGVDIKMDSILIKKRY